MKPQYKSRIVAFIDGCIFELARFNRGLTNYDIRFVTRGLSAPWWVERTLNRNETITPRWQAPLSPESHRMRAAHARTAKHAAV